MVEKVKNDKGSINDRIKQICKTFYDDNTSEMSREINVNQSTLRDIVGSRKSKPRFDTLHGVASAPIGINPEWLLTGKGEMIKPEVNILHDPPYRYERSDNAIALYNIDAAANLKTLFENKVQNVIGQIEIPDMPIADGAIRIKGDSMYPLLKSGDIVIYKEVHHTDSIIFGEMYLVDFTLNGDYHLVVKYVKRSHRENYIQLISYNTHHEPMDIPLAGIRAIALIKASIRFNTMI